MFSPLLDPALLHASVDRVKQRAGTSLTSTLFASPAQIEVWTSSGELSWQERVETVLLQKQDCGFSRLYHVSAGIPPLERALEEVQSNRPLVVDLIGKRQDLSPVSCAYHGAGFREHTSMIRMARTGNPLSDGKVETPDEGFATSSDIDLLHRFFLQFLDPFVDQIPTKGDLMVAVQQRSVLTIRQRQGSGLDAVLVFERRGLTCLLRYWYVDPALHNRGLGGLLMKRFFSLCDGCRRILLWVVESNQGGVTKYKHYGFEPDQLTDRILVRRNA